MSFSKLKPIPKALVIGIAIAAVVYGVDRFVKFPDKPAEIAPVEVTQVAPAPAEPVENPAVLRAEQRLQETAQPASQAAGEPEDRPTVSSGKAGLDALLKKGKN